MKAAKMTSKAFKSPPTSSAPPAPVSALERPQTLKRWASDVVQIVKKEEVNLFEDWEMGRGSLTRVDLTRILGKISGCGSLVELRSAFDGTTGEVGAPVVHAANYCGQHTICPFCAGRVQDRRGARFRDSILEMARSHEYAYMITATIPPVETWREDLDKLIHGWQSFRRMGQKRKDKKGRVKRSPGEWGKVCAGLAKIELKRGAGSGLPHCHYHALVFTNEPFDYRVWSDAEKQKPKEERTPLYKIPREPTEDDSRDWVAGSKFSAEWFKASGATNIRLDPLRYRAIDRDKKRSREESIFEQSREVLKYATKFDSVPSKDALELFARDFVDIRAATYNRRLFIAYGEFRNVKGNDFEGGGPHISENPIIFESRWRGLHYSPLVQIKRPIYLNTDKGEEASKRLVVLNRAQGMARRMRSAVIGAKNHYIETGEIRPAYYSKREYHEDGSFTDHPMAIEPPALLLSCPDYPEVWESWIDDIIEQGRTYYAQVRERLLMASLDAMDGTIEEKLAAAEFARKAWLKSKEHDDYIIRLFRKTLERKPDPISMPSGP